MIRILFIDDERDYDETIEKIFSKLSFLHQKIVTSNIIDINVAKTYEEAINFLSSNHYDMIFFDHDLGSEKSGMDIAKWITNGGVTKRFQFYVHSANPEGARNINSLMLQYNHHLCEIEHHISCYGKPLFTWEWCTIDHLGIWAFGGENKEIPPRFISASFYVPQSDKIAGWYCYIGPEPSFSCLQKVAQ